MKLVTFLTLVNTLVLISIPGVQAVELEKAQPFNHDVLIQQAQLELVSTMAAIKLQPVLASIDSQTLLAKQTMVLNSMKKEMAAQTAANAE